MQKNHPGIEAMLAESVSDARRREAQAFDEAAGSAEQKIVIYGAGTLGRKILHGLRAHGSDAIAFTDANESLAGTAIDGVPVLGISDVLSRFGNDAVFVVCVWNPVVVDGVQGIVDRLGAGGARRVTTFPTLFWKYPATLLPHYLWGQPSRLLEKRDEISAAFAVLEQGSRNQFERELRLRLFADFRQLQCPRTDKPYFPREVFRTREDEYFIDCGAYDGDTIRSFLGETGGNLERVVAFEPDPENFSRLRAFVAGDPTLSGRVAIHHAAVSESRGQLRFAATAGQNAAASPSGNVVVDAVCLDEVLAGESPTFIKMDIEGSEIAALNGAAGIVAANDPLLAVCVYHLPEHLWEIPLWLHRNQPDSMITLASYCVDGFESVCFAVPPERVLLRTSSQHRSYMPVAS